MVATTLGISPAMQLRIPRGSDYVLRLRIATGDDFADLSARSYVLRVYSGRTTHASIAGAIDSDDRGSFALFRLPRAQTEAIVGSPQWELAELFGADDDASKTPLAGGLVFLAAAAPLLAGDTGDGNAAAIEELVWTPAEQTMVVSMQGAPGRPPTVDEIAGAVTDRLDEVGLTAAVDDATASAERATTARNEVQALVDLLMPAGAAGTLLDTSNLTMLGDML